MDPNSYSTTKLNQLNISIKIIKIKPEHIQVKSKLIVEYIQEILHQMNGYKREN
jgi:hypothetical protein